MHGLPSHLLSKSSKTEVFGDKKAAAKTEAGVEVDGKGKAIEGSQKTTNDGFAALFANLTGKGKTEGKASEVKSELGETLKNLLAEKNNEKTEGKTGTVEAVEPKTAEALMALAALKGQHAEGKVEQKIAKTTSNLDQLLNGLKGTQDTEESTESENGDSLQNVHTKKGEQQIKSEFKSASPLDFLMNGAKNKGVGETTSPTAAKDIESLLGQKKVMTGEDYLKNMESSENKASGKLALLKGAADLPKNNVQTVKGYGQGLALLSEPLIKNTKDLASKESKKSGNSTSAIDELRTPETKVGAELSAIKQDAIPGIQNNKNNHGQQAETQTQTNQKVLDLGKINTANTTEIIKRISDYVEQNQVANKSSLDLTVKHESLGEFKIQVSKMPNQPMNQSQNLIDMQITTSSKEGHDFFVKNELSLMKNLSQAGVNLSDLRIISTMSESTPFGQSDSKQSSSFKQNPDGTDKQFMSFESNNFSGDTGSGSERRKELWEEYQQRYGA